MHTARFADDYYRMTGRRWEKENPFRKSAAMLNSHALRCLYAYRMVQQQRDLMGLNARTLKKIAGRYGLKLDSAQIGTGLYLGHPYNIMVCGNAVIGDNCNLNKGASIIAAPGTSAAPKLGDRVWVGINAVLCGDITIGSNVLIAPNAYVDFDVPDNSIVIGNPAQVITDRPDAVEGYINHVC